MLSLARVQVREPWSRRADEPIDEYLRFLEWLHTEDRGIPVEQALAVQHEWAPRARAYDELFRLSDVDPLVIARKQWGVILASELTKIARLTAASPNPFRSSDGLLLRDLEAVHRLLADLPPLEDSELTITEETREEAEKLVARIRNARKAG